jgi:hypothetical protein
MVRDRGFDSMIGREVTRLDKVRVFVHVEHAPKSRRRPVPGLTLRPLVLERTLGSVSHKGQRRTVSQIDDDIHLPTVRSMPANQVLRLCLLALSEDEQFAPNRRA